MDYESYDPVSRYPPTKFLRMLPGCATFRLLELILNPTRTPPSFLRNVILVSIDIEYSSCKDPDKRGITLIGVATLDTNLLSSIDVDNPLSLKTAIQARCFKLPFKRVSRKRWTPTFFWGEPENIRHDQIRTKLKEVLHDTSAGPHISPRNVILIGHNIRADRRFLIDAVGYDIKYVSSVKAILDTGRMVCKAYDLGIANQSYFPLRFVLRCLGVKYDHLHNAGNDAMFTMKALLLMFTNWKHQKGRHLWNTLDEATCDFADSTSLEPRAMCDDELLWESQLEVLTAIAREPWPVLPKPACRK